MAYKYKYKPIELKNPYTTKDTAKSALASQKTNLEKRFQEQGINPAQFSGDMDTRNAIEKALNLKQDQGFLFDVFEVLDRPRNVIANMLESTKDSNQNVLEGAWEGLSGQDDVSTREALETATGEEIGFKGDNLGSKVGNFALDVGLDTLIDPLTYIPGGVIAKGAGKLASKGGKVGSELIEAGLKRGGTAGAIAESATKVKNAITKVGYSFDASKGLTDEALTTIGEVSGEVDNFKAVSNARLKEIRTKVTAIDEKAGKYMGEALENNITFKADGNAHYKTMKQSGTEMLDDMAGNIRRKDVSNLVLARTTSSGVGREQIRRLVDQWNEIAKAEGLADDIFRYNTRGSKTRGILEFKGTADEFFELRKLDDFKDVSDTVVDFGERRMSESARKFFKNNEEARKAFDEIKDISKQNRELMQQLDESGVAKYFKDLSGNVAGDYQGYMRHSLTEGASEYLEGAGKAVKETFTKPGSARFGERTYKATARDINQTLKEVYGHTDDLFNEDAFKALEETIEQASKTYTQTQMAELVLDPTTLTKDGKGMFQSLNSNTVADARNLGADYKLMDKGSFKKEFSNLTKNLPPEMVENLDNMLDMAGATGDAVGMQRSAYDMMKKFDRAYKEIPAFWKGYDKLLNRWKSLNLISGGFHTRNFAGNSTNMFLAGMSGRDIAKYTKDSVIERGKYRKLFDRVAKGETLTGADKKFYKEVEEFYKSGIAQGHAGVRDLGGIGEELAERTGKQQSKAGKLYTKAEAFNYDLAERADDLQRYAMWKWAKNKHGGDAVKAGKAVRDALFDYSSLTSFEKDVMKRLIPFYTFMKNNLAFQGKNLLQNPAKYAQLGRTYDSFSSEVGGVNREDMPEYMQENMWLPIPSAFNLDDSGEVSFLKLNLPPAEFAEFVENPLKRGVTSVTVPIKLSWELATGTNSFTGAPIKDFAGQSDGGYKDWFRNEKGNVTLTGDPTIQKIMDDLGARQPRNYLSILGDLGDWATGAQGQQDFTQDFFKRLGITDTKDMSQIELTKLYQELEKLRNAKSLYEQQYGSKLPGLE